MLRHAIESLRLFLDLFRDVPPLPRKTFLPGAVLVVAYPLLSVLLGPGGGGQAFVTAFLPHPCRISGASRVQLLEGHLPHAAPDD